MTFKMRIVLITPPMIQMNTPYPATVYLTGFLKRHGYDVTQRDASIELFHRLFSSSGIRRIGEELTLKKQASFLENTAFLKNIDQYEETIDSVIRFLTGKDPMLAHRIVADNYLPQGLRFRVLKDLKGVAGEGFHWAFGNMGVQDQAKYLASLFIDDIADAIRDGVDEHFELSRYGEKIAASAPSFDPLHDRLEGDPTLVDRVLDEITFEILSEEKPDVVGFSIPFPGNVYGAFRMARVVKKQNADITTIFGGGYVNTELRSLKDTRVFHYADYITFDDGERPILSLLEMLRSNLKPCGSRPILLRTMFLQNNAIQYLSQPELHDIPFKECGPPTYSGLPLEKYLSLCEVLNPMHRLWTDGRWNKLVLAHGCYWKKCSFCDVTLDYIGRYEPESVDRIIQHIEGAIIETGQTGFHFVDEAAPPALLKAMAERLIEKKIQISWWGNIRFEKSFTPELTRLLARSGCIAVSGGIEVANDRLLKLMEKGVSVEQVARVTQAFSQSGIMVHAYLMYGFPTETVKETVESLERVRQLFEAGCIQSAYWHRFSATAHSLVGKNPEKYKVKLLPPNSTFAVNDIPFTDLTGVDHAKLAEGLRKAVYNYMLGLGIEEDVRSWFDFKVPKADVPLRLVSQSIQ